VEDIISVEVLQFEGIAAIEKIPPLLDERAGGECCIK
jgi:hypothetical protein